MTRVSARVLGSVVVCATLERFQILSASISVLLLFFCALTLKSKQKKAVNFNVVDDGYKELYITVGQRGERLQSII